MVTFFLFEKIGGDVTIKDAVASVTNICVDNFDDVYRKHNFDPGILHGRGGEIVSQYLSRIIRRMLRRNVPLLVDVDFNDLNKELTRLWEGLDNDGNRLPFDSREMIVLFQLVEFRSLAEVNFTAQWWIG